MAREDHDHIDPEGPSADDLERFGDEFLDCPACAKKVYDQADVCPHCLAPMNADTSRAVPLWAILAGCAALAMFIVPVVRMAIHMLRR